MSQSEYNPPMFGIGLMPSAEGWEQALAHARYADDTGLDFIAVQDHPYNGGLLDTWTLLAYLAAETANVRLLPDVLNLPLRPPVMLAKAAASLDLLTGGRVEMGLGAGGFWDGVSAFGGPRREPGEAVDATEEAIKIMRLFWSATPGQTVSFTGKYYTLSDADPGPEPAHPIGIWVGAVKPRLLRLTGQLADGVIISTPYIPPEQVGEVHASIDEGARKAGRSPLDIRRAYNVIGRILPTGAPGGSSFRPGVIRGDTSYWIGELTRYYLELRMDTFSLGFGSTGSEGDVQVRRFAEEVVPAVREALAANQG
jgi:alkanesulfonate monooxygenase SsuD/methylene tetrahydromethanopterin reductase-like flavin-dependent oxidoreductase (luciferase family)